MGSFALLKCTIPTSLSSSPTFPISISNPYALPFLLSFLRQNAASAAVAEDEASFVHPRESPVFSDGLNWALAAKGVIVKGKAFRNLQPSQLQQHGATISESFSGLPIRVRGNVLGEASEMSRAQFSKLLKQVTNHISSISEIFVHDGAIGLSPKHDAKVRIISDSPSALLSLSNILWKTSSRAVSHDSCPLTVYVASSISPEVGDGISLGSQGSNGFMAADFERLSLVLCGKAFTDANGTKATLSALSGPIISARGGLPLSARLLVLGNSVFLLFVHEDTIRSCADLLVSTDAGVILSSEGVATLFPYGSPGGSNLFKLPDAVIITSSDSSGIIPLVSKLSPGQAAYHFLAGYQKGKFIPAFSKGPLSFDALELAKAFLSKLKDNQISSFLVNIREGEKRLTGKDLIKLVESALSNDIPPFQAKGGALQKKYKSFLLGTFQELPEEFSF